MGLFNETGMIYTIISGLTVNVTGSEFITLLMVVAALMLFALAFRIPIELTMIFIFPLLIGLGAEGGAEFAPILGVGIIYMSILLAKYFFFWK